jgi:SSS family solute:Na+ symporter
MKGQVAAIDLAVIAGYFMLVMGIGFYFWRRSRSVEGFTAADRSMPGWVCGLSILATYVSSISFLALPGKAFATNWNPFVFSLSLPIATWVSVRYFLPYYRLTGEVSAYSHLEHRFGPWARVYAGICFLLTQLARVGSVTYLMALPMHVMLGWDLKLVILLTGITTTIYSFVGGVVAVIWNDAIQAVVLIAGALVCALLMVFGLPEGPTQFLQVAMAHHKFSLGSFRLSLNESTFWVVLIYGLVMNLQNFGIDQNFVQRYIASKSDREARRSLWLGGLSYVPLSLVFFLIGTALFVFYTIYPERLAAEFRAPGKSDSVFPFFIVTELPVGVTGLLIAAIFAAAMSTIATSLNSSATLLLTDYYRRYVNKTATERQSVAVLYLGTILWGILGTLIALAMSRVPSALDAWWTLSGIFGGGMLGLFLLGYVSRRPGNAAALSGVILGLLVILWMSISPRWTGPLAQFRSPFHSFMIIVVGTITILLVGLFVSGLRHGRADESPQVVRR